MAHSPVGHFNFDITQNRGTTDDAAESGVGRGVGASYAK